MEEISKHGLKGLNRQPAPPEVTGDYAKDFLARRQYAIKTGLTPEDANAIDKAAPVEYAGDKIVKAGYGNSMWDEGANEGQLDNLNDLRSDKQPWYSKIFNGVGKGVVLAGTTFLDGTIGFINGVGQGIYNLGDGDSNTGFLDGLWNNETSKALKGINEAMENALPNYYSQYEQEHPWDASSIFSANFLGDKFLKNIGFTVGAFYSGSVWTKALKLPKLLELMKVGQKTSQIVQEGVGSFLSALNEGRTEALNNSTDWLKLKTKEAEDNHDSKLQFLAETYGVNSLKYQVEATKENAKFNALKQNIEANALDMGNSDLLMNLPILTLSNIIQFGKLYANGPETERRVTSAIKGFFKNGYTAETSSALKKAALATSKGFISEGGEELAQSAASNVSGKYQDIDVDNYTKSKYDTSVVEDLGNFTKANLSGIKDTLTDPNAWQEFFIGGLTGLMGMPEFRSMKSADGSYRSPIILRDSVFGRYKEIGKKEARAKEIVDYMNGRREKMRPYYEGLSRHIAYQNSMDMAANDKDDFNYTNAETSQMISDVQMWDNAGRLDELKEVIKQSSNDLSDEDIDAIIKFTTKNNMSENDKAQIKKNEDLIKVKKAQKEVILSHIFDLQEATANPNPEISEPAIQEHEQAKAQLETVSDDIEALEAQNNQFIEAHPEKIGPFINSATQQEMSRDEIRDTIKKNGEYILKAADRYAESKEYFNNKVGEHATDEQIAELVWMHNKIKNWQDRIGENREKIAPNLTPIIKELEDSIKEKEDALENMGEQDKAKAALIEKDLEVDKSNLKVLNDMHSNDNAEFYGIATRLFGNKDNSKMVQIFNDTMNYYQKLGIISFEEEDTIKKSFDEMEKSVKAIKVYNEKLFNAMHDPVAQAKRLDKIKKEAEQKILNKKSEDLKKLINKAQSVKEIREAIKGQDKEVVDKVLQELEKDNDTVKEVQKIRKMQQIIDVEREKMSYESEEEEVDTKKLLDNHLSNLNNADDIYNNEIVDIDIDENSADEDADIKNMDRLNKAKIKTSTIIQNAKNSKDWLDNFKSPVETKGKTTDTKNTENNDTNHNSNTTNKNGITVTTLRTAKPTISQEAPVETKPEEVHEGNKQLNLAIDKAQQEKKDATTQDYIKPIIPELHINASRDGDYRPFDVVVKEKEGKDFPIYAYLQEQGAFSYLNNGQLKVNDEVHFTVEIINGEPTIFMTTKDGQIIGSLPTSAIKLAQVPGLTELSKSILEQYKQYEKDNSTTKTDSAKFDAVEVSRVDKIMDGKVPYGKEDKPILSILNGTDPQGMTFAVVKNGAFVTNKDINPDDIILPANMSNKNGATYILVQSGSGKYLPVALFTRHFNENEVNFNDVTNSSQYLKDFKEVIKRLAYAEDKEDVAKAVDEISNFIHLGGININYSTSKSGDKFITFGKPKLDAEGNFIRVNGKIQNDETSITYSKVPEAVMTLVSNSEVKVNENQEVDKEKVFNQIVSIFMSYNLPMQIDASRVNQASYNSYITNADILTSNALQFSTKGNWFTADPIINNKRVPAKSPQTEVFNSQKHFLNSTIGKRVIPYQVGKQTIYFDNSNYYNSDGKIMTKIPEEVVTVVWAKNAFGNNQNVPHRMKDGIVITNDNRIFDTSSNTFLEGQDAVDKRNEILGEHKLTESTASTLSKIEASQQRVHKDETDDNYYYIEDENGEVQKYERVHSAIDASYGEAFDSSKTIIEHNRNLFDKIDKATANNWAQLIAELKNKYPDNVSDFDRFTDTSKITSLHKELKDFIITLEKNKPNRYSNRALKAGSAVDSVVRDFFNGELMTRPEGMSITAYNKLLEALGQIRDTINANGETFYANNIVLYGTYMDANGKPVRVAGEIDILAVDKNGNFNIYDVKTSGKKTEVKGPAVDGVTYDNFRNKKIVNGKEYTIDERYRRSNAEQYTLQLSFYKSLFEGMFNISVNSLAILPFHIKYASDDSVVDINKENGISISFNNTVPKFSNLIKTPTTKEKTKVEPTRSKSNVQPSLRTDIEAVEVKTYDWSKSTLAPKSTTVTYEKNGKLYRGQGYLATTINAGDVYIVIESSDKPNTTGLNKVETPNGAKSILTVLPNGRVITWAENLTITTMPSLDDILKMVKENTKDATVSKKNGGKTMKALSEESTLLNSDPEEDIKEDPIESTLPPTPPITETPKPAEKEKEEEEEGEEDKKIEEDETSSSETNEVLNLDFLNANTDGFNSNMTNPDSVSTVSPEEKAQDGVENESPKDIKLRKATKEKPVIWNKEAETAWLNDKLPQLSETERVQFMDGLLQVAGNGGKAWGQFSNGVITLSNMAAQGTTYHEAFHAVFNLMLNMKEKGAIIEEAKRIYGNKTALELEELLAEDFRKYVTTQESTGLLSRIVKFFKSLFTKTRHWNEMGPSVKGLYSAIQNGDFSNVKLNKAHANKDGTIKSAESERDVFEDLAKSKPKTTFESLDEETKSLLRDKGWTREMYNLVSEEEREIAKMCAGI